ncbi:hypothetical protein E2C01_073784 [Portunus trituberculatus]|uniref:Uncharacterized protein n=1 Tax=Portunus trituberculatus TaxID=210409 RepID=A0A5B7ICK9_PORTR|nr:hypothetical protein [Portunus trituberculatus]
MGRSPRCPAFAPSTCGATRSRRMACLETSLRWTTSPCWTSPRTSSMKYPRDWRKQSLSWY